MEIEDTALPKLPKFEKEFAKYASGQNAVQWNGIR